MSSSEFWLARVQLSTIAGFYHCCQLWIRAVVSELSFCVLQVYLSLLRMYLSPPSVHCLGPIKMEVLEPQANLQAALQVLELHHSKLDTTKVSQTCKCSVCAVGRRLQKVLE